MPRPAASGCPVVCMRQWLGVTGLVPYLALAYGRCRYVEACAGRALVPMTLPMLSYLAVRNSHIQFDMSDPIFVRIINEIAHSLSFVLPPEVVAHIFGFIPVRRRLTVPPTPAWIFKAIFRRVRPRRGYDYRIHYPAEGSGETVYGNWGSLQ